MNATRRTRKIGWEHIFGVVVSASVAALPSFGSAAPTAHKMGRWIVVTAPAFTEVLQPLIKHRAAEGFEVTAVITTDVLDREEIRRNDAQKLIEHVRKLWQERPEQNYVLLVGAAVAARTEDAPQTVIPIFSGTEGRMQGQPTDNGYGCKPGELMPQVAVGRWPVRTTAEARAMVEKTLAYEQDGQTASWRGSVTLLTGNPGGRTAAEKAIGNWYVNVASASTVQQIFPSWKVRSIYHIPASAWYVPNGSLHDQSLAFLNEGQAFVIHAGHSSPDGFWSDGARFLDRTDWAKLDMPHGAGVFVTCGCWSCYLDPQGREDHDGYGLAAVRNAGGSIAVIGATAESYSVAGYLALNGLMQAFSGPRLPERLGQAWLDLKSGIARGPVDFLTFNMLDYGDGSNGKVSLATQRLEHLEMWMLFGDPALHLPDFSPEVTLQGPAVISPGRIAHVTGVLPTGMDAAKVRVTLERPLGEVPIDLPSAPGKEGPERDRAIMFNFQKAQDYVLSSVDVVSTQGRFEADVAVPNELPWRQVVLRAVASKDARDGMGVVRVPVQRQGK